MLACDNTNYHFQDNRPETFFDNPANRTMLNYYINSGIMALLFGGGLNLDTCDCDAAGDGITNPPAINGNTGTSLTSDDDGGYLRNRVGEYYQTGAILLPTGGLIVSTGSNSQITITTSQVYASSTTSMQSSSIIQSTTAMAFGSCSTSVTCPEDSTCSQGYCFCNSGYHLSGSSCVENSSSNVSEGNQIQIFNLFVLIVSFLLYLY